MCGAIFGSVFLLAGASTNAVVSLLANQELRKADEPVRRSIANTDLFTPVEERIKDHEAMIAKLRDPVAKREEERNLAVLYQELGKRSFDLNQLSRAEESFQKCTHLDPDNPKYLGELATLYATAAVRQAEAQQRVTLYRSSSRCWETAATNAPTPSERKSYEQGAASALMSVAVELKQVGLIQQARHELSRARSFAVEGSPVAAQIDEMLNAFSR